MSTHHLRQEDEKKGLPPEGKFFADENDQVIAGTHKLVSEFPPIPTQKHIHEVLNHALDNSGPHANYVHHAVSQIHAAGPGEGTDVFGKHIKHWKDQHTTELNAIENAPLPIEHSNVSEIAAGTQLFHNNSKVEERFREGI